MTGVRPKVREFMGECDRFLEFARKSGELSPGECDALKYYVYELSSHVTKVCGIGSQAQSQD